MFANLALNLFFFFQLLLPSSLFCSNCSLKCWESEKLLKTHRFFVAGSMQIQPTPSEKPYWHGRTVTDALLGECWSHDLFCKMCQTCYKKPQQSSPCCSVWNRVFSSCCAGFSYLMCSCRCQRAVLRADAFFILLHEQRHFPATWERGKAEHTLVILSFIALFRSVQIYNISCAQTEEFLCFL